MDHRGHSMTDSGRRHRGSEEHKYRHRDGDPRTSRQDAHYRSHFTSPQPLYQFTSQHYHHDYSQADHYRPPSRYGYNYPPNTHWDYRENYGYYEQDYYRTPAGRPEVGQWASSESWRSDHQQYGAYSQEQAGNCNAQEDRKEHPRDNWHQDSASPEKQDTSPYYLGTLENSKYSGLSSSSYELSQYMNGAEHGDTQTHLPAEQAFADDQVTDTRPKFSVPHSVVSFGPAGHLIRVTPGASTQEHISQVEIHSLEVIFSETKEQQEMNNYPGPLIRGDFHKVDAIEFAGQRARDCRRDDTLPDRSAASLLWNLLILLCRQNGQIVGSDIAELLMDGSNADGSWEKESPTLIDFSEGLSDEAPPCQGDDLLTGSWSSFCPETSEKALRSYTQLLLAGRKKEALESAMSSGLWGHALFLASKMDNRSYTTVLTRFTGQITATDPLQTLFQMLSGRVPAAATNCGLQKWGDWKPHLAIMLSNETGDPAVQRRAIITMGDTLASRGLLHAAHICYLTAGVPFGAYTQETARVVLLGSSQSQPFRCFSTNLAIRCTELYEYCQTLGGKQTSIPSFQVYKFLYATRLLDCGLAAQAFHYCEVIARALVREPECFPVLTEEVVKLADRLRLTEGQFNNSGLTELEPSWLTELRHRNNSLQTGSWIETHPSYHETPSFLDDSGTFPDCDVDSLQCDSQNSATSHVYDSVAENQGPSVSHNEDQSREMAALLLADRRADEWPAVSGTAPLASAPFAASAAWNQDSSYPSADTVQVTAIVPGCPQSDLPSAAEVAEPPSETNTMPDVLLHQNLPENPGYSPQTTEALTQRSKPGWFSGWFKSKPKEKESLEQHSPAGVVSPHHSDSSPSPPTISAPPGQTAPTGINPFSRKAGQKLG
ncbi:protein transport protein Sec16B isoform X1 [Synchiropus splendidus]|uniref:protein transport protein Sec16B isoform X1 n=1 Tax=Synchiropus splendidus TaxID=270530 RepID=UPI00237E551A|nr:protein transport protein Sec16B isoform X1 [Synchiropus splendidus]